MNENFKVPPSFESRICGLIVGTAIGDALGLPAEGLSPQKIQRRWKGRWQMRFCFGRGMISDDTEHTIMVAQSLLESGGDPQKFQRLLAWKLRWWFIALPAGVGFATAKACLKLWCGVSPKHSGVKSAGNGSAMRAAIIGAFFARDKARRIEFVRISTMLTHTDVRAEIAARAVAEAAAWIIRDDRSSEEFGSGISAFGENEEWFSICRKLAEAVASNLTVNEFAHRLGLSRGVTGYAFHTVPIAIYAWLKCPCDFKTALISALDCGGDTDTVGAIVGALTGAQSGLDGIPCEWHDKISEWPKSTRFMRELGKQLALKTQNKEARSIRYFWPGVIPRNLFFLISVLVHGLRRLLPPY